MCGIIGYVGRQEAAPILLEGLERMEYRGYDSTGMAVCGDGVLRVCKKKGRVQVLREMSHDGADLPGTLGIGHTRWATHGEPSDVNAHPHLSQSGKFAVVHNGIIENFIALKEELLQKGYTFRSETDTEVVAQLLDYYYSDCGDFFEAMNRLLHAVDGAYALGIICADYPDRLVAARKDAPLLLGFGDGENFIASDVTALIRHTRDIAYMDDGELAILSRSGIRVYDRQLRPVEKKHHHVDWEVDAAEKGGYAHFMLKEIMEQPAAIRKATAARIQGGRVVLQDLTMTPEQIRAIGRIYIVACGSSYHVGMVGKYNLERMLRRSVEVCLASEFRYCDPIVGERDLVIVISQSGETLDTMAALREAKKRGARILSIVNVVGSSIARESDDVLYTWAGPEIAVATTKAYSTQMAVLNLLGLYFGEVMGTVDYETYTAMIRDILDLPEKLEQVLALRRLDRAGAGALLRFRRRKERYLPPQYGGPSPLGGLVAPELTGNDLRWKLRFDRMLAANAALYEELLGGLSLDGCPPRYGVPVILTAGERDWTTPYPLAAAYYDTLSAPCKVFLSLPDAGHLPFRERPEEWSHILLDALAQI